MIAIFYRTHAAIVQNPFAMTAPKGGIKANDYEPIAHLPRTTNIEEAFRMMNVVDGDELPTKLKVRSMMVGDVVVDDDGVAWFCAGVGWEKTSWK